METACADEGDAEDVSRALSVLRTDDKAGLGLADF